MYVKFSPQGDIADCDDAVIKFFALNRANVLGVNYFDLFKDYRNKSGELRFMKSLFNRVDKSILINVEVNKIVFWTEWEFFKSVNGDIIAIGNDVTCIKKFEPMIKAQNERLRLQNRNMLDSLDYAKHIQAALLPSMGLINEFKGAFVIYEPKDIVSGDFYWFYKIGSKVYIISIDCTGHGVPGALMTVLVNALLNEIIKLEEVRFPHQILKLLDSKLEEALRANGKIINDGLDIAVGKYDFETKLLSFSGAFQNIQILKKDTLVKLAGERYPIGHFPYCDKNFKTINYQLESGDRFYLSSDGMVDQFGGARDKKIGAKRLGRHLIESGKIALDEQKDSILQFYNNWKGLNEQVDDVLLMGFEV
jgi:serine phosphatase RsbU (regulator of sigma subunit)